MCNSHPWLGLAPCSCLGILAKSNPLEGQKNYGSEWWTGFISGSLSCRTLLVVPNVAFWSYKKLAQNLSKRLATSATPILPVQPVAFRSASFAGCLSFDLFFFRAASLSFCLLSSSTSCLLSFLLLQLPFFFHLFFFLPLAYSCCFLLSMPSNAFKYLQVQISSGLKIFKDVRSSPSLKLSVWHCFSGALALVPWGRRI